MTRRANAISTVLPVLLIALIVLIALAIVLRPSETMEERAQRERSEALAALQLVEFEATAPDGARVTRGLIEGRWTLLSFGFTHCELACPPMHANTMRLMQKLATADLQYVTMSVDPVHDTPERLAEYTERLGIDTDRWTFLALDAETRDAILAGLMLSGVTDDQTPENVITLPDGAGTMNNIGHPTRFLLIDPSLRVVDMYEGTQGTELDAIAGSIRGHLANAN